MDLVTLVTACALAVDPKLMHALVWHQSGGEPWAVSVQGERSPRVYAGMDDAIREARASPIGSVVRVGLAGLSVPPSRVTASVLLPCRNVAMAAAQIAKHASRCKTHPRLKTDPTFCAVAVYRGSWEQPDVNFATDVATSVAKGGKIMPTNGEGAAAAVEWGRLIEAVASRRDRAAFIALFEHFAPRVKTFGLGSGASEATAEELAQETLVTVWLKADSFVPGSAGAAWIFTIARNLRIDTLRRMQRDSGRERDVDKKTTVEPRVLD